MTEAEIKDWLDHELTLDWLRQQGPIDAVVYATVVDCKTLYLRLLESENRKLACAAITEFADALRQRIDEYFREPHFCAKAVPVTEAERRLSAALGLERQLHEELEQRLEQAITAAVEEEGQECAQILEIEAKRYECGDFTSRKIEELLLTLATKMRARCNKSATEI